jgi:hypothetical protein
MIFSTIEPCNDSSYLQRNCSSTRQFRFNHTYMYDHVLVSYKVHFSMWSLELNTLYLNFADTVTARPVQVRRCLSLLQRWLLCGFSKYHPCNVVEGDSQCPLVHEAQAVGCIFPRKDLVLGRPLRCEPVCLVPSVILVKCLFSYLCIVVAVYPAGNPERWGIL